MQIPPYPPEFYYDVRSGYQTVIQRYEDALQELRKRRWLFDLDMSLTRRLRETAVFKKRPNANRKSERTLTISPCGRAWIAMHQRNRPPPSRAGGSSL
jgi:hypothetical protein